MDKLEWKQRITLKLKYIGGMTFDEIAQRQGWSVDAVESYAQNGKQMFEIYWKEKASKAGL